VPSSAIPTAVDYLEAERERRGWVGQVRRLRGARLVTNPRYRDLPSANQLLVGATEPPVEWDELRDQSEPTLRTVGAPTRRVMLFGEEVRARLGPALLSDGFRERTLWLLSYRGYSEARPGPRVTIRLVDPFLRPAWFTLAYRIEQEAGTPDRSAADWLSLYSAQSDRPGKRSFAAFIGDTLAGTCDLSRIGSHASVERVQTAPEWRGQGAATSLVLRATEEAIHDGARGVQLSSRSPTLNERLYRPCGFEPVATLSIFEKGRPY
jgi:GNAT superfamily N-acetyltransferase